MFMEKSNGCETGKQQKSRTKKKEKIVLLECLGVCCELGILASTKFVTPLEIFFCQHY